MDEILHLLTSSSKENIVALLSKPKSPDEIAYSLHMTRQAVDKHLKDMLNYGVVEKIWVTGSRRPKVEFKLSPLGKYFYESLAEFVRTYWSRGREDFEARLKSLDLMIIKGDIDQKRYLEMKDEIAALMQWFLSDRDKV